MGMITESFSLEEAFKIIESSLRLFHLVTSFVTQGFPASQQEDLFYGRLLRPFFIHVKANQWNSGSVIDSFLHFLGLQAVTEGCRAGIPDES